MDIGLLILRLVAGLTLAAHGAQKLFGWFGGYGLAGTGGFFQSLGFRPGKLHAVAAGLAEFSGGLLLALGLLTPLGALLVLAVMLTAMVSVHGSKGFFMTAGESSTRWCSPAWRWRWPFPAPGAIRSTRCSASPSGAGSGAWA
jgi:putative oxidoreductase